MNFSEKLQVIRKNRGITQEALSEKLGVSRQAVARWESGQIFPDIQNLIELSRLFCVSVDYLIKDSECEKSPAPKIKNAALQELIEFRMKAAKNTYAAHAAECEPSRPASHDLRFEENGFLYIDTYLGGEKFSGEEAVWKNNVPLWAMNYSGRVLSKDFSGDFLKAALQNCSETFPRGPQFFTSGEYVYKTNIAGDAQWFQGFEEIYFNDKKVYECYYHGGVIE